MMVDIKDIAVIDGRVVSIAVSDTHILVNIETSDRAITPVTARLETLLDVRRLLGCRVLLKIDTSAKPLPGLIRINMVPRSGAAELLLLASGLEGTMPWSRAIGLAAPFFPEAVEREARLAVREFQYKAEHQPELSFCKGDAGLLRSAAEWILRWDGLR